MTKEDTNAVIERVVRNALATASILQSSRSLDELTKATVERLARIGVSLEGEEVAKVATLGRQKRTCEICDEGLVDGRCLYCGPGR